MKCNTSFVLLLSTNCLFAMQSQQQQSDKGNRKRKREEAYTQVKKMCPSIKSIYELIICGSNPDLPELVTVFNEGKYKIEK